MCNLCLRFFSGMEGKADSPRISFLRGRKAGLHEHGASFSEISRRLGITRKRARKWFRRWEADEAVRAAPMQKWTPAVHQRRRWLADPGVDTKTASNDRRQNNTKSGADLFCGHNAQPTEGGRLSVPQTSSEGSSHRSSKGHKNEICLGAFVQRRRV